MRKVLVVDDSLSVRKVVERALGARNIEVQSASSGCEAIERIEKDAPDLVVCDVIMPDKEGYEICEWIKTHPRFGRIPVLLISGIVNSAVLERAAKVRSDDVLGKPFAADDLLLRIDRLLVGTNGHRLDAVPGPEASALRPSPVPATLPAPTGTVPGSEPVMEEDAPFAALDLKRFLDRFVAMPGVRLAALVDREGFLIESTGDREMPAELAAALASCMAESSGGIGRELGQGALHGMILEYEAGIVSLHTVGTVAMLVIVIGDPPVLGKVRYYVKKTLPDLLRVI